MSNTIKGFRVEIYKNDMDCTNGGITSKIDSIILVDESLPQQFEVGNGETYLKLVRRKIDGEIYIHAEPVGEKIESGSVGYMFGGNFIYTIDSRFKEISRQPLKVHDRRESQKLYNSFD